MRVSLEKKPIMRVSLESKPIMRVSLYVLHWGRNLDPTKSLGTKHLLTLISDPVPVPLKEVDNRLLLIIAVGFCVVRSRVD